MIGSRVRDVGPVKVQKAAGVAAAPPIERGALEADDVVGGRAGMSHVRFQQLDSVPERIVNIDTLVAFERFVRDRRKPGGPTFLRERAEAAHENRRMRLAGGAEILFDAEMKAKRAGAKPHASSTSEIRGLGFLHEAQHTEVELARDGLFPRRHRKLHVIEGENLDHRRRSLPVPWPTAVT